MKKIFMALFALLLVGFIKASDAYALTDITRIFGEDEYKTSIEISKSLWQTSKNVILVSEDDYENSLCAPLLARYLKAPIIFTAKDFLREDVEAEIERLKAEDVYIVGNVHSISDDVIKKLNEKGLNCVIIGGKDRYDTSVEIERFIKENFNLTGKAILVSGENPADVLSASFVGARLRMPVLLIKKDNIPDSVKLFIGDNKISKFYIMGGEDIISDSAISGFEDIERIFGSDDFQRNALLLKKFENYINFSRLFIASRSDIKYALSGAGAAAYFNIPLIFVQNELAESSKSFIETKFFKLDQVIAIGNESSVSSSVLDWISDEKEKCSEIYSIKTYSDFSNYIMQKFYFVTKDNDLINIDNAQVGQKNDDSSSIYVYIDINYNSYSKLYSYMTVDTDCKNEVENWLKSIIMTASEQYPGKEINCELWSVQSYDSFPQIEATIEIDYNPTTSKWNAFKKQVDFSMTSDGQFIVKWVQ